MTNAHAKAVEAAARAYSDRTIGPKIGNPDYWRPEKREELYLGMQAAITAYRAAMRAEGWVMVRDCGGREMTSGNGILATIHRAYDEGWNACRAAMLKEVGDGQG